MNIYMATVTAQEKAVRLLIDGIVQGVGFRPFIYRLAGDLSLKGWVINRNDGVALHLQGDGVAVDRFCQLLPYLAPEAATITHMERQIAELQEYDRFMIGESRRQPGSITGISPDIAVCRECLEDIRVQPHRKGYPLVNCTNCGPRFTITGRLPYDRKSTSMKVFAMCPLCSREYNDPSDRRFHAQPVACNECGPAYGIEAGGNGSPAAGKEDTDKIIGRLCAILENGGVAAVKGTGGYNLVCDALNEDAVQEVRLIKGREGKPFAVMFRDVDQIRRYCHASDEETGLLLSWRRPVVLLRNREGAAVPLAPGIGSGLDSTGAILPYMPFHYLLFEKLNLHALVFTSANISGEPIVADDREAGSLFGGRTSLVAGYNRKIVNPLDDSVCRITGGGLQIIRRARGFVPEPVGLPFSAGGIFAAGADLKNTFALGKGSRAFISQHIGDLEEYAVMGRYRYNTGRFSEMFSFSPLHVACDMHPDYHSSRYAREMADTAGCGTVNVQHHHAHLASCMAENGLNGKVMGVCFDGTGYGDDGMIWGSEFMVCDYTGFERYGHFSYIPLPGGEAAVREPWRVALACALLTGHPYAGEWSGTVLRGISAKALETVEKMVSKGINTPISCGAGRLFDAVSALLGLCLRAGYEGEAPMLLESICHPGTEDFYEFGPGKGEGSFLVTGSLNVIDQVLSDLAGRVPPAVIAAKFHNGMALAVRDGVRHMHRLTGIDRVMLSGGVFQNSVLLGRAVQLLREEGLQVYTNRLVPVNDGGISLGQLAVAAAKMNK